jgi:hypothetical protein
MYMWVPDTRPLPDGYEFLPAGMIMGGDELHPRILSWVGICFTHPVSDLLPSLLSDRVCHMPLGFMWGGGGCTRRSKGYAPKQIFEHFQVTS